jgi:transposase
MVANIAVPRRLAMIDLNQTTLESLEVGAVPILNAFFQRLQLREIIDRHLTPSSPSNGREPALCPTTIVLVLLRNILLSRQPLYAIPQWLRGFVPDLFDLTCNQARFFNDDRIGRTLDRLFSCSQSALVTDIILQAIRAFGIDLSQFHQDTTSVTFHGKYSGSKPDGAAPHITFGYNKDHRPDLKQLIWSLVVSADGAIPVHFHLHPGNTADDQLHQQTWMTLCQLAGTSDFCYVADCKLASSENMRFIAEQHGTFLTILPRTRKEIAEFEDYAKQHPIPWQEVRRDPPRRQDDEDSVYYGWESPTGSKEGFRVLWYRSSQKLQLDQEQRSRRLAAARLQLKQLQQRANGNTTVATLQEQSDRILKQHQVETLLQVSIEKQVRVELKQQGPGRPGPRTQYERVEVTSFVVNVTDNREALQDVARWDGLFPLITNSLTFTLEEALNKYKYQPFLEKRHQQLKSVLEVAPIFVKNPERVASLLLLYFVSLLVYALIERELRQRMHEEQLDELNLYPEMRATMRPTADLAMAAFLGCRRHHLLDAAGIVLKTFHDTLPAEAKTVLRLLKVDMQPYLS